MALAIDLITGVSDVQSMVVVVDWWTGGVGGVGSVGGGGGGGGGGDGNDIIIRCGDRLFELNPENSIVISRDWELLALECLKYFRRIDVLQGLAPVSFINNGCSATYQHHASTAMNAFGRIYG